MAQYIIYYNAQCTKSRGARKILEEAGVDFEERFYLEQPPTVEELEFILTLLSSRAIDIVRIHEEAWKWSGLTGTSADKEILTFIVSNPTVLERPIIVKDQIAAVMGRPPEKVKILL